MYHVPTPPDYTCLHTGHVHKYYNTTHVQTMLLCTHEGKVNTLASVKPACRIMVAHHTTMPGLVYPFVPPSSN